jgi:4-amino-4-deoxy-L-arabinose transferase-like glycosyltransferase
LLKQHDIEWPLLMILLGCAFFLFIFNLGNQYLWQDEAETALVSKTILTYGIPKGYDGKNYFSQLLGQDYTKDYIWRLHPWLQFYLCAAFFSLFGTSTFVARLPFALFGIASVFMTYALCKTLWHNRKTAAIAALLLCTSVSFLLLSRQCRYYSIAVFFSLLGLYAYNGLVEKKKYAGVVFFMSAVLLFHTSYVYSAILLSTAGLHVLLFHRNRLLIVWLLSVAVILVNVPWIIWFLKTQSADTTKEFGKFGFFFEFVKIFFSMIGKYVFSPYLLLIIPFAMFCRYIRTKMLFIRDHAFWDKLALLLLFILINLIALSLTIPWPFFRYLAPLIPVFVIITALLISSAAQLHWTLATGIVVLLILISPMKDFLYELTHDYDGPIEGIVKYLNNNGSDNDIVAITYGDLPLKFYTNMRVIGGLTGEDLSAAKQAKWVILRKYTICEKDGEVKIWMLNNIPGNNYERIMIDYPDIPFENREDPAEHHFKTVTDEDKVVIFRKIR